MLSGALRKLYIVFLSKLRGSSPPVNSVGTIGSSTSNLYDDFKPGAASSHNSSYVPYNSRDAYSQSASSYTSGAGSQAIGGYGKGAVYCCGTNIANTAVTTPLHLFHMQG